MSEAWRARKVLVLGAGVSGVAVARYLQERRGILVDLVDRAPDKVAAKCSNLPLPVRPEEHALESLHEVDLVVTSPGVAPTNAVLRRAVELGIPVWSEIELSYRELDVPIVAVTGTNGKSTTTVLIGEICRQAGVHAFVGGNLGTPLIEAAYQPQYDLVVAEVSSFQLEWVHNFRPYVGVFLNLSPDHLDRYPDLDAYGAAKMRLFARQGSREFAVLNCDDPWVWGHREGIAATVKGFSQQNARDADAVADGDTLRIRDRQGRAWSLDLSQSPLEGTHNRENILAAALTAHCLRLPEAAAQSAIRTIQPLPHRLQFVREWRGIRFYDDSKGTNIGAVEKSLTSFASPIILLAGGYDKGGDYANLGPILRARVRHAVFFGAAGPKWAEQAGRFVPHTLVRHLKEAVRKAAEIAEPGDVVLLSPGCASFDEFENFAHRGRCFRQWVEEL
ncbi:MAG: UDP-N-acetylmuramoylalanine--D-glutamate ligase [Candidatus Binatia bacterium]|nr:MAG: UDP-N-acetylmuramoylalanine--D-glutamate ligase [Candidatus Binatia bacterium]